jgi:hypothetical protein
VANNGGTRNWGTGAVRPVRRRPAASRPRRTARSPAPNTGGSRGFSGGQTGARSGGGSFGGGRALSVSPRVDRDSGGLERGRRFSLASQLTWRSRSPQ